MKKLVSQIIANKNRPIPILSFPSTQLLGINVEELISSSEKQAEGMKAIAERCPIGASLNMMDLSVEAEAFGAKIKVAPNEIPTVASPIVKTAEDIAALKIPEVGEGRTGIYIEGVKKACAKIGEVPVFCGAIGPYSLAGRLMDMTDMMISCMEEPETAKTLLEKCTAFIISYVNAFKAAGASGVILAEPAAGLLSPELCEEFSSVYVKEILKAVADDDFVFVYHNCGNTVALAESIASIGADIYHFGNAIALEDILPLMPEDKIIMGNLNPQLLRDGTAEDVRAKTLEILNKCSKYNNFIISTGCDIPHNAKWENIDAFFEIANNQ